jgi:glycerol-3-phosphate dehydrogenase (NAD(P)+)
LAKITILGAGGFGLALAVLFGGEGHDITVWSPIESELREIAETRENKAKLPGIKIPEYVKLTGDIAAVTGADIVISGVPTFAFRSTIEAAKPFFGQNTILVNTSKGLEGGTLMRLSEIVADTLQGVPFVVLSGPSHAEEVALRVPTAVVAASLDKNAADYIQKELTNEVFRVYYSNDVIGCELGGALKNVIALAAGICDGLGAGDNTKAALMTRGITEIARLGVSLGAKESTFAGLTGIGDLIVTCTSMHSRNRRAGILIGKGIPPEDAVKQIGTVEGYACTSAAYELSKRAGISMPITEQCNNILHKGITPAEAVKLLMGRPTKQEKEEIWV